MALSTIKKSKRGPGSSTRALLLGASLSTLAIVGATAGARAQSAAEEACAAVLNLRSIYTIERVIERFPNDPCVPLMISSLSPQLLGKLNPELVNALPPSQQRLIPDEIRDMIGVDQGPGTRRSIPGYSTQSQY